MAHSGQITVTTAGTEVNGPNQPCTAVYIKAMGANTGMIYVGNDANAVASTTGYELDAGDQVLIEIKNLNQLLFDSSVNGEKACWLIAR